MSINKQRLLSSTVIISSIFLCLLTGCFYMMAGAEAGGGKTISKIPIIYSKHYNITAFGLQKLHPFDTEKYGKIYKYLVKKVGIEKNRFYVPEIASVEDLLIVHSREYLFSLNKNENVVRIAEVGALTLVPNPLLQVCLLKPMRYATGGTILGSELALEYGWAINLSGGYQHAKVDSGGGFCFFADIPIAVHKLFKKNPDLSVLIIDLDAHQGNGCESIFKDDPRVYILDVYNGQIYPGDFEAKKYIEFDYSVKSYIKDEEYLSLVKKGIIKAVVDSKPDFIVYNAGTDIFGKDPLGCMSISEDGIIKRDEIVFRYALTKKIPILMVLSGGYSKESAAIIGKSIENILKNVISEPGLRIRDNKFGIKKKLTY